MSCATTHALTHGCSCGLQVLDAEAVADDDAEEYVEAEEEDEEEEERDVEYEREEEYEDDDVSATDLAVMSGYPAPGSLSSLLPVLKQVLLTQVSCLQTQSRRFLMASQDCMPQAVATCCSIWPL